MNKLGFWQSIKGQKIIREAEYIGRNPYNGYYGARLDDGLVMWLDRARIAWIDLEDKNYILPFETDLVR